MFHCFLLCLSSSGHQMYPLQLLIGASHPVCHRAQAYLMCCVEYNVHVFTELCNVRLQVECNVRLQVECNVHVLTEPSNVRPQVVLIGPQSTNFAPPSVNSWPTSCVCTNLCALALRIRPSSKSFYQFRLSSSWFWTKKIQISFPGNWTWCLPFPYLDYAKCEYGLLV